MNRHEFIELLEVSLLIASLIFFTALLSDFSVRMAYSSEVWWVKIIAGLLAILVITSIIILLLLTVPQLKRAFLSMLGR